MRARRWGQKTTAFGLVSATRGGGLSCFLRTETVLENGDKRFFDNPKLTDRCRTAPARHPRSDCATLGSHRQRLLRASAALRETYRSKSVWPVNEQNGSPRTPILSVAIRTFSAGHRISDRARRQNDFILSPKIDFSPERQKATHASAMLCSDGRPHAADKMQETSSARAFCQTPVVRSATISSPTADSYSPAHPTAAAPSPGPPSSRSSLPSGTRTSRPPAPA